MSPSEVTATAYVCNGSGSSNTVFSSLLKVSNESAGSNCPAGGRKVEFGLDNGDGSSTANNGILEAGEVDGTTYVCHGQDGINSLVKVTAEAAGANCTTGGSKFETGLDNGDGGGTARDGILQSGEVDSTSYSCNGGTGSGLKVYSSSGTPLFELVSNVTLYANDTTMSYGIIVKKIGENKYTAYTYGTGSYGGGTSIGTSDIMNQVTPPTYPYYTSSDCSTQAYIFPGASSNALPIYMPINLLKLKNFYMEHGNYEVTSGDSFTFASAGASLNYYKDPTSGNCNASTSGYTNGIRVTVAPRIFPRDVSAGWYIAP